MFYIIILLFVNRYLNSANAIIEYLCNIYLESQDKLPALIIIENIQDYIDKSKCEQVCIFKS